MRLASRETLSSALSALQQFLTRYAPVPNPFTHARYVSLLALSAHSQLKPLMADNWCGWQISRVHPEPVGGAPTSSVVGQEMMVNAVVRTRSHSLPVGCPLIPCSSQPAGTVLWAYGAPPLQWAPLTCHTLPACLPACLPVCLSVCLSLCLPACQPACLPVTLSLCLWAPALWCPCIGRCASSSRDAALDCATLHSTTLAARWASNSINK
jgi:hypothetical protein